MLIKKVWTAWKISRLWIKATRYASKQDFEESQKKLQKIFETGVIRPKYILLRAYNYYCLEKYYQCEVMLSDVCDAIQETKGMSQHDRGYMYRYIGNMVECLQKRVPSCAIKAPTPEAFNISSVDSDLLLVFPLKH